MTPRKNEEHVNETSQAVLEEKDRVREFPNSRNPVRGFAFQGALPEDKS